MCFADLGKSLDASIVVICFFVCFFYQKGLHKVHLSAVIVFVTLSSLDYNVVFQY